MLKGTVVSDGIGIGKVMILNQPSYTYKTSSACDSNAELERFEAAVDEFCKNTELKIEKLRSKALEKEIAILESHIGMLNDPSMGGEIKRLISEGACAETAVKQVCDMFVQIFSASDDELLRLKAEDVRSVGYDVTGILSGEYKSTIAEIPKNTVLVVNELTPSMVAELDKERVLAVVSESGGRTSHSAILLRALEIPAVFCVENATKLIKDSSTVIVDGNQGLVINAPDSEMLKDYCDKRENYLNEKHSLEKLRGEPTQSASGEKYCLLCNIGDCDEAQKVLEFDGEGVGLFRSELMFMEKSSMPTEDEQFLAYRKAALILKNKPLTIRTLDIGGDKNIPYLNLKEESNPFMGLRGIRYCLKNPEIFKTQLRAILRAGKFGDVRIMFPFVTCVEELLEAKRLVEQAKSELRSQSIEFCENIKIGVMVETAAAALIAELLAKEADFISIGTNDLTSYIMACDRGNGDVSYLYSALQTSVVRSIKHTVECCRANNIPVGVCGVTATNPLMIPLFMSFGLNVFSVYPSAVLKVRKMISMWSRAEVDKITETVMSLSTEAEIRNYLNSVIDKKQKI